MPKSKKPPAKAAEGKPAAVKPVASAKAPATSARGLAASAKALAPPRPATFSSGKTAASAGSSGKTAASAGSSGKTAASAGSSGKAAVSAGAITSMGKSGVSMGKGAAKAPAPAAKAVLGKDGGRKVPQKAFGSKSASTKAARVVEPPQPAEPRKWPKGGPTKPELKRYRDRLLEMRRVLLSSSKELAAEALKSSGQDFSVDHMADNGSDNYEQDFSLKLLEGESEQLADIREALMKIDGKVETPFGICEACADEDQKLCETCPWIPPSRLEVLPHARLCVQTKEIEERRKL